MTVPRPWVRWRRWGLLLVFVVLGFEALYLITGNLALNSDWLQERINRRPARVMVTWASGSTFIPGNIYLKDVRVTGQSRKSQYAVTLESGHFVVNLWRLTGKHVHVRRGESTGLDVRLRRRLDSNEITPEQAAHFPPIEGLLNPPTDKPEELYPKKKPGDPWTITVDRFNARTMHQVWINGIRLEGEGQVSAGFHMVVRGELGVPQAHLVTHNASISMGQNLIAQNVSLTADVQLARYRYKEVKGKNVLGQLSANILMQGDLRSLGFVDDHGASQAGVRFGGAGSIHADLRIDRGRFMPGSQYSVDAESLQVDFLGYSFLSSGAINGKAWNESQQVLGSTEVTLGPLTGHRLLHPDQSVTASSFTFTSVVNEPVLAGGEPLRQIDAQLPSVSVPEITMFNDLLPESLGVTFLNGSVELGARFSIDAAGAAEGTLLFAGSNLEARTLKADLRGNLSLDASYSTDDFRAPIYDLAGTRLSLSQVFVTDAKPKKKDKGWWFDVSLDEALIDIESGSRVDATAEFSMRDIKPLVVLLQEEGQAPKWFGMMPNVKDVNGLVELDLDPGEFDLEQMDITGKGLKFLGRLDSSQGIKRAAFYAKYKGLSVGLAMDDSDPKKKKSWTLVKPLKWYEDKLVHLNFTAKDPEDAAQTGSDAAPVAPGPGMGGM
jgi:hypothetical protein